VGVLVGVDVFVFVGVGVLVLVAVGVGVGFLKARGKKTLNGRSMSRRASSQ